MRILTNKVAVSLELNDFLFNDFTKVIFLKQGWLKQRKLRLRT